MPRALCQLRPLVAFSFILLTSLSSWLQSAQSARAADTAGLADAPIPVAQAAGKMRVPEGFQVSLFAGEPDIVQPIAFTFDARGRMWVVECLSYPKWTRDGTGHDRITILEDTDGDGRHDRKTVFYDKGANVSGIEVGFGGVWLCSSPNLVFIPDRNGDDVPDAAPEVVLDGWSVDAKHNVFAALNWGPDGWLYGCNGILSNSRIGKPGTPDNQRVSMNCGVWRYHPTEKRFEAVTHGSTNPWGLDWDDYGQAFITNCVIKHLFHAIPGGHVDRMFGQDANPNAFRLIPSVADHLHWGGGHWTTSRGGADHDDAGGGHAHSGCAIYLADQFPAEYRNHVFMCNIHGNRVNTNRLEFTGSSYTGKRAPDFLFANDPWFRGVAVRQGPVGDLFVSDWCDTGECHNYEVADTTNGRIYRTTYGTSKTLPKNLTLLSDAELVKNQSSRNEWEVRQSRRLLQERAAAGKLSPNVADLLVQQFLAAPNTPARLRSAWALAATSKLSGEHVQAGLTHSDEHVRLWTVLLLSDAVQPPKELLAMLAANVNGEKSPRAQLAYLSAAQRLAKGDDAARKVGLAICRSLAKNASIAGDSSLPNMLWYAVEAYTVSETDAVLAILKETVHPFLREDIARRTATMDGGLQGLLTLMTADNGTTWQGDAVRGILLAYAGVKSVPMPPAWAAAGKKLEKLPLAADRQAANSLAVLMGDESVIPRLESVARSPQAELGDRQQAISILVGQQRPGLVDLLLSLVAEADLRTQVIRGMSAVADARIPQKLLAMYASLTEDQQQDAIQTLSVRPEWAAMMLDAVSGGGVPKKDVSALTIRQLHSLNQPALKDKITGLWGEIRPASEQRVQLADKYRRQLTPDVLASANLERGQSLFKKNCGNCHKLHGEGGIIGPELTGSQRTNLEYILENVVDPSSIVPFDYRVTVLVLHDGRIVQGIVVGESEVALTVQTVNERLMIGKDQIDEREKSALSLMPEGLFDNLSGSELSDLVAYLKKK